MATPLRTSQKQSLSETPNGQRLALAELEELLDKENYSPMLKTWKTSGAEISSVKEHKLPKQKLKPSLSQQRSTSSPRQTTWSVGSPAAMEVSVNPLPSKGQLPARGIVESPFIASPSKTPSYVAVC